MAWQPDYILAADLKAFLHITDTVDDTQVQYAVTTASRAIDRFCNRQFGQVTSAEQRRYSAFPDNQRGRYVVPIDDLGSATSFAVQFNSLAVTSYQLEPFNALLEGRVYTRVTFDPNDVTFTGDEGEVYITGLWGWANVPVAVQQACLLQGSRIFNRRTSPYGIAGSPQEGSELRLLARVDPDVSVSLMEYKRPRRLG
nr:hypothetical protein Hi04_10k_c361_00017 [uncultured bacterium]